MPADMAFILIFSPLLFSVIFPFLPLAIVYLSEMVAVAFVVFIMAYGNYYVSSTLITFLLLESMFYLYIFRDQEMGLFLHSVKNAENELMKQQAEQERKLAKRIANEMKIFISTISHDLKSVRKIINLIVLLLLLILIFLYSRFQRLLTDLRVFERA
jgi:signal transduction histidine kinase